MVEFRPLVEGPPPPNHSPVLSVTTTLGHQVVLPPGFIMVSAGCTTHQKTLFVSLKKGPPQKNVMLTVY